MAGLARLARRKKELEDLYAFVEDVEAPDEVLALAFEEGRGLGDASQWIRPLRDMLCRVDVAGATNRPLFVRFTAIEMLHVDTWSKAPLLTCRASWHSKCSPAKLKAWSAATGRMPPRMARLDYAESLVVHIGRVAPNPALAWRQNHSPGLAEGWRDGEWLVTAAGKSVAESLREGGECCSVGGLGTPDRALLLAAAEQRLVRPCARPAGLGCAHLALTLRCCAGVGECDAAAQPRPSERCVPALDGPDRGGLSVDAAEGGAQ